MDETELRDKLKSLREQGKIGEGIELLKENTGKGKIIDPSDTPKMENLWSSFANPLLRERGQIDNFTRVYEEMFAHIMYLQDQETARYHKGLSVYNMAVGFLVKAYHCFLLSFVEDSISSGAYPEEALSTAGLQQILNVDSEFLQQLSQETIAQTPSAKDPNTILSDPKVGVRVPGKLWQLEYQMREIERKLREFIEKMLSSASQEWWKELVPPELQNDIDTRMINTSKVLWFSEQPTSPLEYLSFPHEYTKIIIDDKCWSCFKSTFKNKAILAGRLEGLGHIRHKIAHYRKISDDENKMFSRTIQWLKNCIK